MTKGDHVWSTPYWSDEFKIEFDAIVTEIPPCCSRKSLFHLTTGEDSGEGGRLPAVFVRQGQSFHMCYHVNDDTNYCKNYKYELNKEYHFEISQQKNSEGEYWYSIKVNGETFDDVKNETPLKFEDVKLYLSDPWSESFAPFGKLSNLKIIGPRLIGPGKYIFVSPLNLSGFRSVDFSQLRGSLKNVCKWVGHWKKFSHTLNLMWVCLLVCP